MVAGEKKNPPSTEAVNISEKCRGRGGGGRKGGGCEAGGRGGRGGRWKEIRERRRKKE